MKFVIFFKIVLIMLLVHNAYSRQVATRNQPTKLKKPLRPNEITKVNVPIANVIPQEGNVPKRFIQNSCKNPDFKKKLEKAKGTVACKLLDTIVHIKSEDQSVLTPSAVLVKRCSGVCGANQKKQCIPLISEDRTFHVRQIIKNTNQIKCLTVAVSEDVKCGCDCPQKEIDCNKDVQRYNKERCICECMNDHDYKKCKERVGKNWQWNQAECVCKCKEVKVCTTGAKFNEKHCKCKKTKPIN